MKTLINEAGFLFPGKKGRRCLRGIFRCAIAFNKFLPFIFQSGN
jgi:hypothetical protein